MFVFFWYAWMGSGFVGSCFSFFFNDTATTEIYTLSLHDALPIFARLPIHTPECPPCHLREHARLRSEEHTSELQSHSDIVCRLLLEQKKKTQSRRSAKESSEHQHRNENHTSCG